MRTLHELVHKNILTVSQAVARLSTNPARILGVPGGVLEEGKEADITIFDLERNVTVTPETMRSKSRNTPFGGWTLKGGPVMTIVAGHVVWEAA